MKQNTTVQALQFRTNLTYMCNLNDVNYTLIYLFVMILLTIILKNYVIKNKLKSQTSGNEQ